MKDNKNWTAQDWWTYYVQLYIHYLLPENAVVRMVKDAETGEFAPDTGWFEFATEAVLTKIPPHTALMNHSNPSHPIKLSLARRVYNLEDRTCH
jgi:hypothetical protein